MDMLEQAAVNVFMSQVKLKCIKSDELGIGIRRFIEKMYKPVQDSYPFIILSASAFQKFADTFTSYADEEDVTTKRKTIVKVNGEYEVFEIIASRLCSKGVKHTIKEAFFFKKENMYLYTLKGYINMNPAYRSFLTPQLSEEDINAVCDDLEFSEDDAFYLTNEYDMDIFFGTPVLIE